LAWDGTGYGLDGTVWGGEFFLVEERGVRRVASLRPFSLPGGDTAAREPRRSALGLLHELRREGGKAFEPREREVLHRMIDRGVNAPRTSSMGRLFDAVASLAGLRQRARYEGQAAMELEYSAAAARVDDAYPFGITEQAGDASPRWLVDWAPMVEALLADLAAGSPARVMAAKFHNGLVEAAVCVARAVGQPRVLLSGGCFQNRYLTERLVARLRDEGFRPYWHQRIPPNDGGIALGQVVAATRGKALSGAAP
jgi:hydrogenase maturation protein HypF